jgi:endonuclease/exonuclease/phosphatase family metal-dependent hydrolase
VHLPDAPVAACRQVIAPDRAAYTTGEPTAQEPVDIQWELPPDQADHSVLNRWCATVGPAVFAINAIPPPASSENRIAASPENRIAVLSWNIHVGGGNLPEAVAALQSGQLTGGRPVEHFVLLVQEALRSDSRIPAARDDAPVPRRINATVGPEGDIVATARRLGLHLFYVPSMRNGREPWNDVPEDRGNAILSTLPLSDPGAIELPFERQRRVAAAATITGRRDDGSVWKLRVVSGHLDGTADAHRLWLFASGARARQAAGLAAHLGDASLPTVLGSDLNTWSGGPREAAYVILRERFPTTPVPPRKATFRNGGRLDYLFLRLPADWTHSEAQRVDDRFNSDHHPVLVEITAGPAASQGPSRPMRAVADGRSESRQGTR